VPGLNDRAQDNWRPLLSVAETVGDGWPLLARAAATILSAAEDEDGEEGTLLLADLYELFHSPTFEDAPAIKTDTILAVLHGREDRPWRERGWKREPLTPTGLARLLKPFGVRPTTVNLGGERAKGYRREQLENAWSRYLPPPPEGG
jgi:putative DNA primase/helicase